jgi:hypothetical protein
MEDFEGENPKNLYVIRSQLSARKMLPGDERWSFDVGRYYLVIALAQDDFWRVTDNLTHREAVRNFKIIDFEKFDIYLYEHDRRVNPITRACINLKQDSRFKDHLPIQYNVIETPTGGRVNLSDGKNMPLIHLMELIKYLHRLSDLTVFE